VGLSSWRSKFFKIRSSCRILVRSHAFADYPERGFSKFEITNLIKIGNGHVKENKSSEAIPGSYLFLVKDEDEVVCKLVVLIEEVEIEDLTDCSGGTKNETIIVCSAYRGDL